MKNETIKVDSLSISYYKWSQVKKAYRKYCLDTWNDKLPHNMRSSDMNIRVASYLNAYHKLFKIPAFYSLKVMGTGILTINYVHYPY